MRPGEAPGFWWRAPGWQSALLAPLALAYGAAARRRLHRGERADAGVPVLCVGNFTVGGGGKTPTALALAEAAARCGRVPGFLSRGYGGRLRVPTLVDPARHDAGAAGDEPMLLARQAPTAVGADRSRGAALLREAGCDFILMDDGFQSARLRIDLAVLVVDASRGFGNGRVVPAGPVRAPLRDQIRRADAVVVIGGRGPGGEAAVRLAAQGGKPAFEARLRPRAPERFEGRRVLAFAGIADPGKFYRSLEEAGAELGATRDFPDHHPFTPDEVATLREAAERDRLSLVTTRKDAARLDAGGDALRGFLEGVEVLDVDLVFDPAPAAERLVRDTLEAFARRTLR